MEFTCFYESLRVFFIAISEKWIPNTTLSNGKYCLSFKKQILDLTLLFLFSTQKKVTEAKILTRHSDSEEITVYKLSKINYLSFQLLITF